MWHIFIILILGLEVGFIVRKVTVKLKPIQYERQLHSGESL
jgi:Na+-transporting NADH:ubiquinone oxidoreductase subunit NqrC